MSDELQQVRNQLAQRFLQWRQTAVPDWKYALLLARSFEAVPWPEDTGVRFNISDAPGLASRLAEIARLWAVGGRLTQSEADDVAELANRVVQVHELPADATAIDWFCGAISLHVTGLQIALTEPRYALAYLMSGMEQAGQYCPTRSAWWLQIILRVTECLHPTRMVTIDPRWRTSDTLGLAQAIYEDRALNRLPILADALMDAGCNDDYILSHCRVDERHPDECWALDLFGLAGRPKKLQMPPKSCPMCYGKGYTVEYFDDVELGGPCLECGGTGEAKT